jgi:hypothetical protein
MCAGALCPPRTDNSLDGSGLPKPDAMSKLSIRTNPENPNHHLWNNHGTWFVHYVVHPTPWTKERVRRSLGTRSIEEARRRRDELFEQATLAEAA